MPGEVDEHEDDMALDKKVSFCGRRERRQLQNRDEGDKGGQNAIRSMERNSLDEDGEVVRRKMGREEVKIVLTFRKEDKGIKCSSVALSKEIQMKIGEVDRVKLLSNGNWL